MYTLPPRAQTTDIQKKFSGNHYTTLIWAKLIGKLINNIRYADNIAILTSNIKELQHLLRKIKAISENYGLKLNVSKTK